MRACIAAILLLQLVGCAFSSDIPADTTSSLVATSDGSQPGASDPDLTSCSGTATGTLKPVHTIFVTIEEGYPVTVTQNATTLSASTILYTPPPICVFVTVPATTTLTPYPNATSNSSSSSPTHHLGPDVGPTSSSDPGIPGTVTHPGFIVSGDTTTITVTKKTPVPITTSDTQSTQLYTFPAVEQPGTTSFSSKVLLSALPSSSQSQPQNTNIPPSNNAPSSDVQPPSNTAPSSSTSVPTHTTATAFLLPIANSISSSNAPAVTLTGIPFITTAAITTFSAVVPTATLVNGVPVQVQGSSVYVGGSFVSLPSGSTTATLTIAGQTFTVAPSGIIAQSTTLNFISSSGLAFVPVQVLTLPASTITQNGITITISASQAMVSGTTFSIGINAQQTTTTINGQLLTFGSNGVAFPSKTYAPAITTTSAYITSSIGSITISIDSSEAIISGTTFPIGSSARGHETTAVVSGTTFVFGATGIVVPGQTTIAPTAPHFTVSPGYQTGSGVPKTKVVSESASGSGSRTGAQQTALAGMSTGGANTTRTNIWLHISMLVILVIGCVL